MEPALKSLGSKYRGSSLRPALFWKVWLSHRCLSSPPLLPLCCGGAEDEADVPAFRFLGLFWV